MRLKFLIVEDDVLISEHLNEIITSEGFEVTDICSNEQSAYNSLETNLPNLALLDIRLQGNDSGIEIAKQLNELNIPFYFITSFSDKITLKNAIEHLPKGYILKPFEEEEIREALHKLTTYMNNRVTLKTSGKEVFLDIEDLNYAQSENVYIDVYAEDKKYLIREKLSDFVERVGSSKFIQTHRSYAVNLSKVTSRKRNSLFIEDVEIPVSKKYETQLEDFFTEK